MVNSGDEKDVKKSNKKDITGAADLEKVTDYAPEKDISDQDAERAYNIIDNLESRSAKSEKEKELAKVVCRKEDIELIVKEMEISKSKAEQKLRENNGDVVQTLVELTN